MLLPFFYTAVVERAEPIYLVGMMGVGKSTVGSRLAARLGRSFADSDREVERMAGRSIAEIFASDGEARFRALESEAVENLSSEGAVIALGGGTIAQPGMVERLEARGPIVFLMADPTVLVDRIGSDPGRPLLAGLDRSARIEKLRTLLAERWPYYARARIRIEANGDPDEIADRIVRLLEAGSDGHDPIAGGASIGTGRTEAG